MKAIVPCRLSHGRSTPRTRILPCIVATADVIGHAPLKGPSLTSVEGRVRGWTIRYYPEGLGHEASGLIGVS
ncbi:hypothetical protein SPHV1_2270008 [Novosphingobium sp. KN65.2]|nr:hypothetical protein SPHV1_2270008 [Novosphingobium sp. KN65.2]